MEQRLWIVSRQVGVPERLRVLKREVCVLDCGVWGKKERKQEAKRGSDKLGEDERVKRLEVLMCL